MEMNVSLTFRTDSWADNADAARDVRTLMGLVGIKEQGPTVQVTVESFAKLFEHLKAGEKIQAIKAVRNMTGLGLSEAKNFVEDHFFGKPTPYYLELPE